MACNNRSFNPRLGVICKLSGEKPNFHTECADFTADPQKIQELNAKEVTANKVLNENILRINKSARWFYWIAILSIVNSLVVLFDSDRSFLIGLGSTLLVDYIIKDAEVTIRIFGLIINLLISSIFFIAGYFGSKMKLWAFKLGGIIYLFDALLVLKFGDYRMVGFHILAIVMIAIGGYKLYSLPDYEYEEQNIN